MKPTKPKLNLTNAKATGLTWLKRASKYKLIGFIVFVAIVYGFVYTKINSYSNVQPSQSSVDSSLQAAQVPRIDNNVISQLQSLQDNSVSVQSLFNQARSNPFQ